MFKVSTPATPTLTSFNFEYAFQCGILLEITLQFRLIKKEKKKEYLNQPISVQIRLEYFDDKKKLNPIFFRWILKYLVNPFFRMFPFDPPDVFRGIKIETLGRKGLNVMTVSFYRPSQFFWGITNGLFFHIMSPRNTHFLANISILHSLKTS